MVVGTMTGCNHLDRYMYTAWYLVDKSALIWWRRHLLWFVPIMNALCIVGQRHCVFPCLCGLWLKAGELSRVRLPNWWSGYRAALIPPAVSVSGRSVQYHVPCATVRVYIRCPIVLSRYCCRYQAGYLFDSCLYLCFLSVFLIFVFLITTLF